jgi:hypothetical protein
LATRLEGNNPYSNGTSGFFAGESRAYFLSDTFPFDDIRIFGSAS